MRVAQIALALAATASSTCIASDFFMSFQTCKALVTAAKGQSSEVKATDAEPFTLACDRNSKKVTCAMLSKGNDKPREIEYSVELDAGQTLMLKQHPNGGDFIIVDRKSNSAGITSRFMLEEIMGAKVCQGAYLTDDELKALRKSEPKSKK